MKMKSNVPGQQVVVSLTSFPAAISYAVFCLKKKTERKLASYLGEKGK